MNLLSPGFIGLGSSASPASQIPNSQSRIPSLLKIPLHVCMGSNFPYRFSLLEIWSSLKASGPAPQIYIFSVPDVHFTPSMDLDLLQQSSPSSVLNMFLFHSHESTIFFVITQTLNLEERSYVPLSLRPHIVSVADQVGGPR